MAYYLEADDRDLLKKLRLTNVCAECGVHLEAHYDIDKHLPYLVCSKVQEHQGIAKEYREPRELNILSRREKMEHKFGQEKTRALAKYQMAGIINRDSATEIVETLWKGASPVDKTKAILLCATYNLNPLMNHLFMLPFQNKKTGKTDYAVVIGIEATRLMAHRKHKFTYLDLTPRKVTTDELEKILGKENIKPNTLYVITKGKDLETGAEGYGLGSWSGPVYGEEKGNSAFNMASIRSERQFFKRMYPAEQPAGVDVVDERFVDAIEGEYREVDQTTGEITEGEKPAVDITTNRIVEPREAKPTVTIAADEPEPEEKPETPQEAIPQVLHPNEKEASPIDLEELKLALNTLQGKGLKAWSNVNVLGYLNSITGQKSGRISEAVKLLTKEQAQDFWNKIQEAIEMS